jgi:hypothetical protein
MKTCPRCKIEKPKSEFHKRSGRSGGLQSECKTCRSERHQNTYADRRDRQIALSLAYRKTLLDRVNKLKQDPCQDCGGSFPSYVMDFDHRDGRTKVNSISKLVQRGSWAKILAEIVKCDLICANCHRIRTWRRAHGLDAVPERLRVLPAKQ